MQYTSDVGLQDKNYLDMNLHIEFADIILIKN